MHAGSATETTEREAKMGHTQLGDLPKTLKWQQVISLIVHQLAAALVFGIKGDGL